MPKGSDGLHYRKDGGLDMRYSSSRAAASSSSGGGGGGGYTPRSSYTPAPAPYYSPAPAPAPAPAAGLHYRKDGGLDMRYASSRAAAAAPAPYYSPAPAPYYSSAPAPAPAPSTGLHYRKDGGLDMRYASSRAAAEAAAAPAPYYSPAPAPAPAPSTGLHYRKDGGLDMRYATSRAAAEAAAAPAPYYSPAPAPAPAPSTGLHYRKDGGLDMRYASSRAAAEAAAAAAPAAYSSPATAPAPAAGLHYRKDGGLDMRYASSRAAAQAPAAAPAAKGVRVEGPRDPTLHFKKDGTLDMRYKSSKMFVMKHLEEALDGEQIPSFLPRDKHGSPDCKYKVVRDYLNSRVGYEPEEDFDVPMTAEEASTFVPHPRMSYWQNRVQEPEFLEQFAQAYHVPYVPPAVPDTHSIVARAEAEVEAQPSLEVAASEIVIDERNELGRGNFGTVYSGTFRGKSVAIKRLTVSQLTKRQKRDFDAEILALRFAGAHPNIVKLFAYCMTPPIIVTELVQLGSLHYLLHCVEDPEIEAQMAQSGTKTRILLGVVDAMVHLHSMDILHCDLKPANVLITNDYQAKLCDFGLSMTKTSIQSTVTVGAGDDGKTPETAQHARGTYPYMAPELATTAFAKPSDVYSFGILMNEVIAEEEPYYSQLPVLRGRGADATWRLAQEGKRPDLAVASGDLSDLIKACWHQEPARRPTFEQIRPRLARMLVPMHPSLQTAVGGGAPSASSRSGR